MGQYRQAAGISDQYGNPAQTVLAFVGRIEVELSKAHEAEQGEDLAFHLPRWDSNEGSYAMGEVQLTDAQIQTASVWVNRTFGKKGLGQIDPAYQWLKEQNANRG